MNIISLQNSQSGSSARIDVDQGFNCFQFLARLTDGRVVDVLSATVNLPSRIRPSTHYGIPLLFPYPNRIAGGRFFWDGSEYHLPPDRVLYDETGNAIHGLCLDRPWRIAEQSADAVTGVFQLSIDAPDRLASWPTDAEILVSYRVLGSCLRSEICVTNPTDRPLPWGFGTHPYFNVPLSAKSKASQCILQVPARKVRELTDCLPSGAKNDPPDHARLHEGCSFNGLRVDDIYTDVVSENGLILCRITDPAAGVAVEQRCSTDFRELVVFTPRWSNSVCIEPYTCVTNAINLQQQGVDAGLRVLEPGASWTAWIEIEALENVSEPDRQVARRVLRTIGS